ncbi:TlpA family protein disulfide reductase [Cohnella sp.]|uniref:TlpA family protein disulfide reductase n=1 Tax=Cohnella sp. TaxID=1883426 RepID=UPI003568EF54
MKRNMLVLGLVLIAVAAVFIWNDRDDKSQQSAGNAVVDVSLTDIPIKPEPKKNHYAPSFDLASLDGASTFQVGGKRDKALIINFWAAWCGPCEVEAPDLKDIYEKHKDKLDLYAVNATKYDKLREAKDFVKEQGFVFPVLTDAKGDVGDLYKVFSYPISFIIDRNGVIRERIEGVISREEWEMHLDGVLNSQQ